MEGMLFVTVELMSAMQRRYWKTGFKMEGDVSYFLLYLETRKSLKDQKSCDKDLRVKNPYGKLSIVMKCPYKFDESENVHRVK